MTLSLLQQQFTLSVGKLIMWTYEQGWGLTFGDAYRSPEQAAENAAKGIGIADSLHCDRLAIDLNLFVSGEYQSTTAAYSSMGEHWKTLHTLARWGGDFSKPDGNHFSFEWQGRK